MKCAFQPTASSLITAGVTAAFLLSASPCLAAQTAGALPWDQTLIALQNFLVDSLAPAVIVLAFSGAVILYPLGGHDQQAGRIVGSGIGCCVALLIVQLLNYVLP